MKKENVTHLQQKFSKYFDVLIEKAKMGEIPNHDEIQKMYNQTFIECITDLDERLQKLERKKRDGDS